MPSSGRIKYPCSNNIGRILAIDRLDEENEKGESMRQALESRFIELVGGAEQ
jgi:hypothetical protein